MQRPDQPRDEALARIFDQMRADTLARVRPPGAGAARWAARSRQHRRRRFLATAAAVLGMVFAGGLGAGAAQLALSERTERVTQAAADAPGSAGTGATPAPVPAPTPTGGPGVPSPATTTATRQGSPSARPTASASRTYQPTRCHTDELSATLGTPADIPPNGMAYADLGLTNEAGHPCRMYGYPGMQLLGADGSPLPTTVLRDGSVKPTLFTLQPGDTGWARLTWSVVPDADETAPCAPDARLLWVTPPDEYTQLTIQVTMNVCHHGEILTGPTHP